MSAETNGNATGAPQQKPDSKHSKAKTNAPVASDDKCQEQTKMEIPEASAAKKPTGAELKAAAKAEKAARRAREKASREVAKGEAAVSSNASQLGPSVKEIKKGKQDGASPPTRPTPARAPPSTVVAEQKNTIPECFSHLAMAKRIPMTQAEKNVHPSILALGQQMATFAVDESIIRLKATMLAFKQVIDSYDSPQGSVLARHFTPHVLNTQIDYLTACRPLSFSMGNAIRWLKLQVGKVSMDAKEDDAKRDLCKAVDDFITERITAADEVITETAVKHIQHGDVVLTYGRTSLVERTLLEAYTSGRKFSVCVIDDPYERAGQLLAKTLAAKGIEVTYCGDFGGLIKYTSHATKVLFGAEAMFSNGAMYARAGACDVALAALELDKEVITLCETINITERVAADSMTYNEIDPERCSADAFRLLFDTTPDKYLDLLVTELGCVEPTSAPDLIRKLEEFS